MCLCVCVCVYVYTLIARTVRFLKGPKDHTNVKFTTGFHKPNRLVYFRENIFPSLLSLTIVLSIVLSTMVGKNKPNGSVCENLW